MPSKVHVSLLYGNTLSGRFDSLPVGASKLAAAGQALEATSTAAKSTVVANADAVAEAGDPRGPARLVWNIPNFGGAVVYAIFGVSLTAGDYNTTNAQTLGHPIPPGGTLQRGVVALNEEVVLVEVV